MFIHKKQKKRRRNTNLQDKTKRKSKWIMIGLAVLTAVLCSLPDFHLENYLGMKYTWWFDMIQHGGYYFSVTIILYLLLPHKGYSELLLFFLFFGSFLFEIIQVWIPLRNFTLLDIASNFIGISLALLLLRLISFIKNKTLKENPKILIE